MRKIILALFAVVLMACESAPFVANTNNELLVGTWKITEVDDAAAMVSKEEFMLSAMHEKYKEGYVFEFEKGPKFSLKNAEGSEVSSGQYAIGANNESLTLQIGADKTAISYDLKSENNTYTLTVTTPGEMVNLTIAK